MKLYFEDIPDYKKPKFRKNIDPTEVYEKWWKRFLVASVTITACGLMTIIAIYGAKIVGWL